MHAERSSLRSRGGRNRERHGSARRESGGRDSSRKEFATRTSHEFRSGFFLEMRRSHKDEFAGRYKSTRENDGADT